MNETERGFHGSVKPHWTTDGNLVYSISGTALVVSGNMVSSKKPIVSEHSDVRFARFSPPQDVCFTSGYIWKLFYANIL